MLKQNGVGPLSGVGIMNININIDQDKANGNVLIDGMPNLSHRSQMRRFMPVGHAAALSRSKKLLLIMPDFSN